LPGPDPPHPVQRRAKPAANKLERSAPGEGRRMQGGVAQAPSRRNSGLDTGKSGYFPGRIPAMSNAPPRPGEMSTSRLLALADGIFAIAMTLLVFEIKVPLGAASAAELGAGLFKLWPKFAACALTFLTLGFSWIGHHNQYVAIRRTDRTFLWINI